MNELPPVAGHVVADIVEKLPQRLRKRLDASLEHHWQIEESGDRCTVTIDADTTVTFRLTNGILAAADDLTCNCLLAPRCLHRAVAVSTAPVSQHETETVEPLARTLSDVGLAAANSLWEAGSAVLRAGVSGTGAVLQAQMLRAAHSARLAGLHRAATAALRVVAGVRAAGGSAFDRTTLTADLVELLLVCRELRAGGEDVTELLGTARRAYEPVGALRLFGLCAERVVAKSGYGGVVSHLVDATGNLWTIPAILPGGQRNVAAAWDGPVALGESGISHRQLSRGGLLVASATASADRRLGAGQGVRAVAAPGAAWTDEPFSQLWQKIRAGDLVFLEGTVAGFDGSGLVVSGVELVANSQTGWENLRMLGALAGHRLKIVGRITDRPGTALALAAFVEGLPDSWGGRVNLSLEPLQRAYVGGAAPVLISPSPSTNAPVDLLERWLHRIVMGGHRMPVVGSVAADRARLDRLGLAGAAQLLDGLHAYARDPVEEFTLAWLRGCVYAREFRKSAIERSWSL